MELYYPRNGNKSADQLRGYREADLRLCFRICKMFVFSLCGSLEMKVWRLFHLEAYNKKWNFAYFNF